MRWYHLWPVYSTLVAASIFRDEAESQHGSTFRRITCVGQWEPQVTGRGAADHIDSLARGCWDIAQILCSPMTDAKHNRIDLVSGLYHQDYRSRSLIVTHMPRPGAYAEYRFSRDLRDLSVHFPLIDYCLTKCRCTTDMAESSPNLGTQRPYPDGLPVFATTIEFRKSSTEYGLMKSPIVGMKYVVSLDHASPPLHLDWGPFFPTYFSPSINNAARCSHEEIPIWLHSSLRETVGIDYSSNAALCLHRFFGGHNATNLGGICLISNTGGGERKLDFDYARRAPIFTSDVDPLFSLQALVLKKVIPAYCSAVCVCSNERDESTSNPLPVGQITEQAIYQKAAHSRDPPERIDDIVAVTNEILRLGLTEPESVMPSGRRPNSHSATSCAGATSCTAAYGKGSCPKDCLCAAKRQTVVSSLSNAIFVGACISRAMTSGRGSEKLGGRGLDRESGGLADRNGQLESVACPCNATYISKACCDAPSGTVWEHPHLKLGKLA